MPKKQEWSDRKIKEYETDVKHYKDKFGEPWKEREAELSRMKAARKADREANKRRANGHRGD